MKIIPAVLLCAAGLLSLWMLKADHDVPGSYTRWGVLNMTAVWALVALRWLLFTIAFSLLLASGRLNGWAPIGFFRIFFVIGGIILFEILAAQMHYNSVSEKLDPKYHLPFAILAVLFPACVIAAGLIPSRALFIVGLAGSLLASFAGSAAESSFHPAKPWPDAPPNADIGYLLLWADPMYGPERSQELLERIAQRPSWIEEVSSKLDDPTNGASAMYVLCRQPARLGEALQERCWIAVHNTTSKLDAQLRADGHAMLSDAYKLREAVKGLAGFTSPVRERHRGDFAAAREVMSKVRVDTPSFPELFESDWTAAAADGGTPPETK